MLLENDRSHVAAASLIYRVIFRPLKNNEQIKPSRTLQQLICYKEVFLFTFSKAAEENFVFPAKWWSKLMVCKPELLQLLYFGETFRNETIRSIGTVFIHRRSLPRKSWYGLSLGSITSRCSGKWAHAHPPKARKSSLDWVSLNWNSR